MLFWNSDSLDTACGEYLGLLAHAGVLFRSGLGLFLQDRPDEFQGRLSELRAIERQAAVLQRGLAERLRRHGRWTRANRAFAPSLEYTATALHLMTALLRKYAVEQPEPVLDGNAALMEVAECAKRTVDAMTVALRAQQARASNASTLGVVVQQAAEETREAGERYKRMIFRLDLRLSHKNQLGDFADAIEAIADAALAASDRAITPRSGDVVSFGGWVFRRGAAGWLVLSAFAIIASAMLTLTSG